MIDPSSIIAEARRWIGTPYHHQGRLLGVGVDCVGLVVGVGLALGLPVFDRTDYARVEEGGLEAVFDEQLDLADGLQPGRVMLIKLPGQRWPRHCGIVSDIGMIHVWEVPGRCVEHRISASWVARVVRCYRFKGD